MLLPHDALLNGACNSEESRIGPLKFACNARTGIRPMMASRRAEIMSRLPQRPAAYGPAPLKPAAVLIPILEPGPERESESVLFTLRTDHLEAHAGQVCFPGGRYQAGDQDLAATALRETEEEIGLRPEQVAIGGFLDPYTTITGYSVLPVVGFIAEPIQLLAAAHEVAEIFEVPLAYLLDPANRETRQVMRAEGMRDTYAIRFGRHTIWGATAGMIVNLARTLGET
jgi:8-oxo-dGTP pyrophosphatase MutT (NUDIX family)